MTKNKDLIEKARSYSQTIMTQELDPGFYSYHNMHHVDEMTAVAKEIAEDYNLSADDRADIEIACLIHDIGYKEGAEGHEERAVAKIDEIFADTDFSAERKANVSKLIRATKMDVEPVSVGEKIIKDADCHHVGVKQYLAKTGMLKEEMQRVKGLKIPEKEWLEQNLKFLHEHRFFTAIAESKFNRRKRKNLLKIQNQLSGLIDYEKSVVELNTDPKAMSASLANARADRGIETMYRVTLRNHNALSVIADNKANIMLSINAIMLSIILSSLASKLEKHTSLIAPTVILSLVCVVSVILAVLATRPKISSAPYSDEAFMNNKFNMLFFGNFYKLPLEKFEWGLKTLMNNEDMLYSSLSKDLYFLGLVLAKKYKILRYCYNVFTVGIIIAVIAFIWAFLGMSSQPIDSLIN